MITYFIIITLLAIVGIILIIRSLTDSSNKNKKQQQTQTPTANTKSIQHVFNEFEIKGAAHNIFKKTGIYEDSFCGYLQITHNIHDKYAVGIYRHDSVLIGYLPKKSISIYNYLKQYNIKKLPCWGYFTYQSYRTNEVFFYTHITKYEMFNLSDFLFLNYVTLDKLKYSKTTKEKTQALNKLKEIVAKYNNVKHLKNIIKPNLPHNFIQSLSKSLEEDKNWTELLELEKYKDFYTSKSVFNRIQKAKENLQQ